MNPICEVVLPNSSEILTAYCQNHQSYLINNCMNHYTLLKNMAKLILYGNMNVRMIIKSLAITSLRHELLHQFITNESEQQALFSTSDKKKTIWTRQV